MLRLKIITYVFNKNIVKFFVSYFYLISSSILLETKDSNLKKRLYHWILCVEIPWVSKMDLSGSLINKERNKQMSQPELEEFVKSQMTDFSSVHCSYLRLQFPGT